MLFGNHRLLKSKSLSNTKKLLQILIKWFNPQILFCKFQTNLQIQELSLNPEKYFANCQVLLAPAACHRQRFAASKLAGFCVSCSTRVDQAKVNPGDKFCFKCGSKVTEISHQSARIRTTEDERASSSSSTKSLSQYTWSRKRKNAEDIGLASQITKPVWKGTSTIQNPGSSSVFKVLTFT